MALWSYFWRLGCIGGVRFKKKLRVQEQEEMEWQGFRV